jgi:23S rRNA pseudouridine1911/1915/1917 synthase
MYSYPRRPGYYNSAGVLSGGMVLVEGSPAFPKLKGGTLLVRIPPPSCCAGGRDRRNSYEDSDIIVVNKAAGMVVHQGAGNFTGTLVNALLGHCSDLSGIGGEIRPGIVHRIDKDTTGVLVVAKNDHAHRELARHSRHAISNGLFYIGIWFAEGR